MLVSKSPASDANCEPRLHFAGADHLDPEAAARVSEPSCDLNHIIRVLPVQIASAPQDGRLFLAVDQRVHIRIPYRLREIAPFIASPAKKPEFRVISRRKSTGAEHIGLPPRPDCNNAI